MMKTHPSNTRNYESKEDDISCESEKDDISCESDELDDGRTDSKISKPIPSNRKKSNESKAAHYSKISSKPWSPDHVDSKQNVNSKWSLNIWLCASIIGFLSILFIVNWSNAFSVNLITVDVEKSSTLQDVINDFDANINDINYKFKNQDPKIWNEIYAGVVNVKENPEKRSIIFLFSNDEYPMSCLAKMVGNASKAVLNTDILYLSSSNLGNDYGAVIAKFEEQIKQQRVVIVDNLLEIDVQALRAFHNLCDSENPVVRQTIYILTMIANGYENNQRPIDFVTKQLERKLKGKIQSDKLQPLITRITDAAIYPVQPEPGLTSCPLRY